MEHPFGTRCECDPLRKQDSAEHSDRHWYDRIAPLLQAVGTYSAALEQSIGTYEADATWLGAVKQLPAHPQARNKAHRPVFSLQVHSNRSGAHLLGGGEGGGAAAEADARQVRFKQPVPAFSKCGRRVHQSGCNRWGRRGGAVDSPWIDGTTRHQPPNLTAYCGFGWQCVKVRPEWAKGHYRLANACIATKDIKGSLVRP